MMTSKNVEVAVAYGTLPMGVLNSVNFGYFAPSTCQCFHCNAIRKTIKARMNWHKIQQNEHTNAIFTVHNEVGARLSFHRRL